MTRKRRLRELRRIHRAKRLMPRRRRGRCDPTPKPESYCLWRQMKGLGLF